MGDIFPFKSNYAGLFKDINQYSSDEWDSIRSLKSLCFNLIGYIENYYEMEEFSFESKPKPIHITLSSAKDGSHRTQTLVVSIRVEAVSPMRCNRMYGRVPRSPSSTRGLERVLSQACKSSNLSATVRPWSMPRLEN